MEDKKKEVKKKEEKRKRDRSVFREYFELIAETAVFVFFVMTFVVQAFQIPTGSMKPTLLVGDFLLVNKFAYYDPVFQFEKKVLPRRKLKRNDIVVFKFPRELDKDFVKRIIALEGEKLEIKDRQVYIDGKPIPDEHKVHMESQVSAEEQYFQYDNMIKDNFGPFIVPEGHCFVMGDNRDNSSDSRYWGSLPMKNIKGKPWVIYFSYSAEKNAHLKNSLRDRLKKFVSFFLKARPRRMLKVIK